MGWARLDDGWHDHPKVIAAGLDAAGAWVMCLTWAHANRRSSPQPGFIPQAVLGRLAGTKATRIGKKLSEVGLLDRVEGGWLVHDFADYLPKYDPAQAAAAGRKGAGKRWAKGRGTPPDEPPPDSKPPYDRDDEPPYEPLDDSMADQSQTNGTRASTRRNPVPVSDGALVGSGATDPNAHEHAAALAPLRTALEAVQLVVRWDKLTPDQASRIAELVAVHGTPRLVGAAQRAWQRDNPPAFAQAWIGAWDALPPPRRLRSVAESCSEHALPSPCISCAADRKAAQ